MNLLQFFDNIWLQNLVLCLIVFYLLVAIVYAAHFSTCEKFDGPILLGSFNLFSSFFLSLILIVFCFDFVVNDKLYFFNQNFQLIFLFFIICVSFTSYDFLTNKNVFKYEYDLLFIFVVFSGICLCFSNELLFIYVAIELQSLTLYIFATFNRNSEFSTEAGLKYFVFGGIMSCFLLFGICLVYLFFGSVTFETIASIASYSNSSLFFSGFIFILVVLMFKVGSAPFHFWLCDVYEGSIIPVTLLFASAPKIVLFGLTLKLCFFVLYSYNFVWSFFLGFSAIFSIIVGSISAIYQKRLKRLFAYSTIAHTGFILLAFLSCSIFATKSLVFYVVIYSSLTITIFSLIIYASNSLTIQPKYLICFSGIGNKNPIFAAAFGLTILAVAGIPPLAGFFSKLFILISVIGAQFYFTALTIVFFSSIACFYYIRMVKIMFFVKNSKNEMWVTNKTKQSTELISGVFLFFIICYFLYPNLIINFSTIVGILLI